MSTQAKPSYKCTLCNRSWRSHEHLEGIGWACRDGQPAPGFVPIFRKRSASNSFKEPEVECLHAILMAVAQGKDTQHLKRHPAFGPLSAKIARMQLKLRSLVTP